MHAGCFYVFILVGSATLNLTYIMHVYIDMFILDDLLG